MARPHRLICIAIGVFAALAAPAAIGQTPLSQAFTYQGQLTDNGAPANGPYDLIFVLFRDATATGPAQTVGNSIFVNDLPVADGLFMVTLNSAGEFSSNAFVGDKRWLEIRVRPGGETGAYGTLAPRQELTVTPHAAYALSAPWSGLSGIPAGFADGVDDSISYTAGAGLQLVGTQFSIASGAVTNAMLATGAVSNSKISSAGQVSGKVLKADGAGNVVWNDDLLGGLTLPYSGSTASGSTAFAVTSSGLGDTIRAISTAPAGAVNAIYAQVNNGSATAIEGHNLATSGTGHGAIFSANASPDGEGARCSGGYIGVRGDSPQTTGSNYGGYFNSLSPNGYGARGQGGSFGLYGLAVGSSGRGVAGIADATTGSVYGGYFSASNSPSGTGVFASGDNVGVHGTSTATSGPRYGGYFSSASTSGKAAYGDATSSTGSTFGGYFSADSPDGTGVYGLHSATTGFEPGVHAKSQSTADGTDNINGVSALLAYLNGSLNGDWSAAVRAIHEGGGANSAAVIVRHFGAGSGVDAYTLTGKAVQATASNGVGVNYGVWAVQNGQLGYGVYGKADLASGAGDGVRGHTDGSGYGVFSVGELGASGTKSFVIDHPLDPENQFLKHYCHEGPEPQNVYNGLVTLDPRGEATVTLPAYFESINRDPRYSLTPVGAAMPGLHVATKISLASADASFRIAGGAANQEVSWEVKAVRNDAFVRWRGVPVEVQKNELERGRYQHPAAYGQPKERGIDFTPTGAETPAQEEQN